MPTINDVRSWRGQDLVDADGGKIGSIEEIYVDSDTDQVEWALATTGLLGSKQSFVPRDGPSETADGISVPLRQPRRRARRPGDLRGGARGRPPRPGTGSREARRAEERVRLEKDVETDEREVSETVRKERIHVDDAR